MFFIANAKNKKSPPFQESFFAIFISNDLVEENRESN